MVTVTALYAGLLALIYVFLSMRVINTRKSARVSFGDGGNAELNRRIRIHGNFAEYAPMGIILLGLSELHGAPAVAVHVLGLALLAGRVLHAVALTPETPKMGMRVTGMMLTFGMLGVTGAGLVLHALL
ncbi:MAPEG family protein [Citreimonas sp.]|uniref:MAPEG family protein n=1 Tax=Citreimonas sp. TaxID=3036715 RepID=UPI0040596928